MDLISAMSCWWRRHRGSRTLQSGPGSLTAVEVGFEAGGEPAPEVAALAAGELSASGIDSTVTAPAGASWVVVGVDVMVPAGRGRALSLEAVGAGLPVAKRRHSVHTYQSCAFDGPVRVGRTRTHPYPIARLPYVCLSTFVTKFFVTFSYVRTQGSRSVHAGRFADVIH